MSSGVDHVFQTFSTGAFTVVSIVIEFFTSIALFFVTTNVVDLLKKAVRKNDN